MKEQLGANVDLFEKLFVDPEGRKLARRFVEGVSGIPGVNSIGVGGVGDESSNLPVLFVISQGDDMINVSSSIEELVGQICPDPQSRNKLGQFLVTTQNRLDNPEDVNSLTTHTPIPLWQRTQ